MDFLEKDLEDIIWDSSQIKEERELLAIRGLDISGKLYRQVKLGEYGILDLMSIAIYNSCIEVTIYELKKDEINFLTMMQASRYGTAIREYIGIEYYNLNRPVNIKFVLIGKSVDLKSDFIFLYNHSDNFTIKLYTYALDGLRFSTISKGYTLSDEDFKNLKNPISKDDIIEMKYNKSSLPF